MLSDEALEILARGTQGIPRLVNQALHQAFTLAASAGVGQVEVEAALEALAMLGLDLKNEGAAGNYGESEREGVDVEQGGLLRIAAQEG